MVETPFKRLLATDVRPQRFGYVVFESPIRLVDWGTGREPWVTFHRRGGNAY
jgi:hypothetical protein